MIHREIARYSPEFGNLEVEVVANKWYFPYKTKKDHVSKRIVFSKMSDYSNEFWPDVETCFQDLKQNFDLVCAIPASEVGMYSPTLSSLGNMVGKKYGIPFENIILRVKKPIKKMTVLS